MPNFRFHLNGLSDNQDLLHTYHPYYSVSHHRNRRLCLVSCGEPRKSGLPIWTQLVSIHISLFTVEV